MASETPTGQTGTAETGIDMGALLAEIDAEVSSKRASGELPADFERSLDLLFARYAPVDASVGDFEAVLARVVESANIELLSPVQGSRAQMLARRAIRKAIRWYIRWIAEQVSGFGHATAKALQLLDRRIASLEPVPRVIAEVLRETRSGMPRPDLGPWRAELESVFDGCPGRALVAECGTGEALGWLVEAGVDAYGVDPDPHMIDEALLNGLEARVDDAAYHMEILPGSALGGALMAGFVDYCAPGEVVNLLRLASEKLAPGGRLAIVGRSPAEVAAGLPPVMADLSAGRGLHRETWAALLAHLGFTVDGAGGSSPGATSYLVSGTRR